MLTRQRDVIQACCNYRYADAYSRLVSASGAKSAPVRFDRVTKVYDGVTALHDFSLEIRDSEFMVLVGPSGCGKTTALRIVAGLEEITEGEIFIGERSVGDLDPRSRDVAMVFQNYALYPHMTVFENIAFGLRARRRRRPRSGDASRRPARRSGSRTCWSASRASFRAANVNASRWGARSSATRAFS